MEPKSIAELKKEHNIPRVKPVKKGPDSVEYGEQWLDDLEAIVIDPIRTPNIAKEFENIDYQTDKDGNVKPRLEDKDNHCVTGDTLIDTSNGQVPIKDLVGTTGLVKCFNEDKQIATESTYFDVRLTRKNADVFEIETESGRKIKATSDHLILTTNGWKMVKELNSDDEITSIERQKHVPEVVQTGKEPKREKIKSIRFHSIQNVYNMEVEDHHNYSVDGGLIIHNCIDATRYALERDMRQNKVSILT